MTALLDQLLLRRNRSSPTSTGMPQEAIALWVGLCEGALPMGMDPLFTCQQEMQIDLVLNQKVHGSSVFEWLPRPLQLPDVTALVEKNASFLHIGFSYEHAQCTVAGFEMVWIDSHGLLCKRAFLEREGTHAF
eukprot:scaffold297626_cov19-Tisochrysis_lutea.AAC.1